MASLKKKVIVRDKHWNHLQNIFDKFNVLTLTAENMTEINSRKYQKTFLEKSELLKNLDDEIDEEDVYRISS